MRHSPLTRRSHSPIAIFSRPLRVPLEIVERIINAFLIMRSSRLRTVGPVFDALIQRQPVFWEPLIISARTPLDYLAVAVSRANPQHLNIDLRLQDEAGVEVSLHGARPRSISAPVASVLTQAISYIPSCKILHLHTANSIQLMHMMLSVQRSAAPNMRNFLVSFPSPTLSDFRPRVLDFFHFHTFEPNPPCVFQPIASLWIECSTSVEFPIVTYDAQFATLQRPAARPFTWMELMAAFESSDYISHLALHSVEVTSSPEFPLLSPSFPIIHHLDLNFDGHLSMARFVSHLVLPRVRQLTVNFRNPVDLHCLCKCSNILTSITQLELDTFVECPAEFYALFRILPCLLSLDLTNASPSYFHSFAFASRQATHGLNWSACPRLQRLALRAIPVEHIEMFITQRTDRCAELVDLILPSSPPLPHTFKDFLVARHIALHQPQDM
ncbi:hypothetical protein B0H10DRAFT_2226900 [Mycena sp. CBHHK59/15]|nr:hypothetical protein B0H10DRAFT_2226900 [Mycena sp. CBHHK59/15]